MVAVDCASCLRVDVCPLPIVESSCGSFVSCVRQLATIGSRSFAAILVRSHLLSRVTVGSHLSDEILVRSRPFSRTAFGSYSFDEILVRSHPLSRAAIGSCSSDEILVRSRSLSRVAVGSHSSDEISVRSCASTGQPSLVSVRLSHFYRGSAIRSFDRVVSTASFLYRLSAGLRSRSSFVPLSLSFKL